MNEKTKEKIIAEICHEANRIYCESIGDYSQNIWKETDQTIKNSALAGVIFTLGNPDATAEQQHEQWRQYKEGEGWKWGPVKQQKTKEHPCMVSYAELPAEQQIKDQIFRAIVGSLAVIFEL